MAEEDVSESEYDERELAEAFEIDRILKCADFYEVMEMGISDFDGDEEKAELTLREKYLEKTLLLNPARSLNQDAQRAFQLLSAAYDCLVDPLARATYNGEDPVLTESRRVKEPPLLEALADTLHEMTEEQELHRKGTVFKGLARGLLWMDRIVNKQTQRRRSSESSAETIDDATTQSSYNDDESDSEDGSDDRDGGLVATSWKKGKGKVRRATYSQIDKGSKLRRLARDFLKLDTVVSSMVSISKESRRRLKQRKLEELAIEDREDYDSDSDSDDQS